MLNNKGGLGRGLGSLIPNKINQGANASNNGESAATNPVVSNTASNMAVGKIDQARGMHILEIDIEKIKANPFQPRQEFNHNDLEDLINSIKEHGILQPLVVTRAHDGNYELIAGERRLRASKISGLKTVPVIVREAGEQKKLELALIENIQRKDLNSMEEAKAYKRLMEEFNLTQEETSARVGKSLAVVANALRLLNLPLEIQDALTVGKLDKSAARTIAGLEGKDEQLKLFREIMDKGIKVRELERYVRQKKNRVKKEDVLDMETEEKQNILQNALGTKVRIEKKGQQGKIIVEFYSPEELTEIIKKINK